jgi:arsenite-transporting ATPase
MSVAPDTPTNAAAKNSLATHAEFPGLGALIEEIERPGKGLIMFMGKGGVGKTTTAAAVACELAARGHDVLLTTTDPAGQISETLDENLPHLTVGRINPAEETARYRAHVLETKGRDLAPEGRAMLEEDLRSPCTEEIAVFQAFSRVIRESARRFVVVDTAPPGHTLLLLDATGAYHRDIVRHADPGNRGRMVTPMMRYRTPNRQRSSS